MQIKPKVTMKISITKRNKKMTENDQIKVEIENENARLYFGCSPTSMLMNFSV